MLSMMSSRNHKDHWIDAAPRPGLRPVHGSRMTIALLMLLVLLPGCLFRKKKIPVESLPSSPIKIALLPANIPDQNQELRWVSLAMPILLAKELENAQDLEVVPLWESIPIALETLGSSREVSAETPAYVASRLGARWATQAEITPSNNGVTLLIDFMPAKATLIPYRYKSDLSVDSLRNHLREALVQFVRYLAVRRLPDSGGGGSVDPKELRQLAEAMDREYGWFAAPDPGRSEQTFQSLARTDDRLARLLFKPPARPASGSAPSEAAPPAPAESIIPSRPAPAASELPTSPGPAVEASVAVPNPQPAVPAVTPAEIIESTRATPAAVESPEPKPTPKEYTLETPRVEPSETEFKTEPTPAGPAGTLPSTAQSGRNYWIQVYSTQVRSEAEAKATRFSAAGFDAEIVEVDLDAKGVWYRIRLKGYKNRKEADEAAQKLLAQGMIAEYWIAATPNPE